VPKAIDVVAVRDAAIVDGDAASHPANMRM
jgi:hypothetical protein